MNVLTLLAHEKHVSEQFTRWVPLQFTGCQFTSLNIAAVEVPTAGSTTVCVCTVSHGHLMGCTSCSGHWSHMCPCAMWHPYRLAMSVYFKPFQCGPCLNLILFPVQSGSCRVIMGPPVPGALFIKPNWAKIRLHNWEDNWLLKQLLSLHHSYPLHSIKFLSTSLTYLNTSQCHLHSVPRITWLIANPILDLNLCHC